MQCCHPPEGGWRRPTGADGQGDNSLDFIIAKLLAKL